MLTRPSPGALARPAGRVESLAESFDVLSEVVLVEDLIQSRENRMGRRANVRRRAHAGRVSDRETPSPCALRNWKPCLRVVGRSRYPLQRRRRSQDSGCDPGIRLGVQALVRVGPLHLKLSRAEHFRESGA